MAGKLKVYGTMTHLLPKQARTIAAVTSQKEFAALIGTTLGYVQTYASETGNEEEIKQAFSDIGTVFVKCPCCETWVQRRKSLRYCDKHGVPDDCQEGA